MRILLALPEWIFDRLNASFEKKWEDVIRTHGLQRMVAPRLDHDFFVFTSSETEAVNVLYRRRDGDYGLIESRVSR